MIIRASQFIRALLSTTVIASLALMTPAIADTITNTGTDTDGIDLDATNNSLVNSGDISNTANSAGVFSSNPVVSIENKSGGTITGSGTGAGIGITSTLGTLINNGTITSGATGPGIFVQNDVQSIINNGTISGGSNGVDFNGLVGSFTNTGTITAAEKGALFNGGVTHLTNSGTIKSTAASSEVGLVVITGDSTIDNSGTIVGPTGIAFNSATATNKVINSGTIQASEAGEKAIEFGGGTDTLKLVGNSRIIGIVEFGGGTDTLDFAEFQGSTVLEVYNLSGETVVAGDNLFQWNGGNDKIALIDSTALDGAPIADSATNIATSIESIIAGQIGNPINGLDNVAFGYVAKSETPAETAMDGAMAEAVPSSEVWASIFGGFSKDSSPADLDNKFGGLVAGSHALFGDTTVGVLASAAKSRLDINSGAQEIDTTTGVIGLYGRHQMDEMDLNFSILVGSNKHDSSRAVLFFGTEQTAVADFSSWFISSTVGVEIPVLTTDSGTYNVATSLNYIGGEVDGYSESGSGLNLSVGDAPIHLVELRVELNGQTEIGQSDHGAVVANSKIGLMAQSNLGGSSVPVSFFGGAAQNFVTGQKSVYGLYLGADIVAPIAQNIDLQFGADYLGRSDGLNTLSGTAKIIAKF